MRSRRHPRWGRLTPRARDKAGRAPNDSCLARSWISRGPFECSDGDRTGWLGRQDPNLCISKSDLLNLIVAQPV